MTDNELPAAKGGAAVQRRRGLADTWPFSGKSGKAINVGAQDHGEWSPSHGAAGGQARFDLARNGRGLGDPPRGRRRFLPAKGKSAITEDHPTLGGPK